MGLASFDGSPFSTSPGAASGAFADSFHPKLHLNLFDGLLFSASIAAAASSADPAAFSLRPSDDEGSEGRAREVAVVAGVSLGRERQTSFMSFSSKSLQVVTMLSRSSDQTIRTFSSRWKFGPINKNRPANMQGENSR